MRDLESLEYFPFVEEIVDTLCIQNNNPDRGFFRNIVIFGFGIVASSMRTKVHFKDRGKSIPVNTYVMNLAGSGYSKTRSLKMMETEFINQFKEVFLTQTFPEVADKELQKLATKRSNLKGTELEQELESLQADVRIAGETKFFFDSGSPEGIKQQRRKMVLCNVGSLNFVGDELAKNLFKNQDIISTFLEMFDTGEIKDKLIKNTAENVRGEDISGRVPTNALFFGTPAKLLDGSKTEDLLRDNIENGLVRRCLYYYTADEIKPEKLSAEARYARLTDPSISSTIQDTSNMLGFLADPKYFNTTITVSKEVSILLHEYEIHCEERIEALNKYATLEAIEMKHRYFNVMKLSGIFAFILRSSEVTEDLLYQAITYIEDSGKSFKKILNREPAYVRLCGYLSDIGKPVTRVELMEALPIFKGTVAQQNDLITLATTYGYTNNAVIKKLYVDGIEFLEGASLKENDLSEILVSCSIDVNPATGYMPKKFPWDKISTLTQRAGKTPWTNWCNHQFIDNHRADKNALAKFNLVVLDVDSGTPIETALLLLKKYTFHIHTTKRHTGKKHRYRIIIPISHELSLSKEEHKLLLQNIFAWLPFEEKVDEGTTDRCRKWATHKGETYDNEGELLDVFQFIPKTTKSEETQRKIIDSSSLNRLERWFLQNTAEGNRNKQLHAYARMLVDSGHGQESVQTKVLALNEKLPNKMDEARVYSTILVTVAKAIGERDSK